MQPIYLAVPTLFVTRTMSLSTFAAPLKVNAAILRSPGDWMLWHQEFRCHIVGAKLADYFDGKRERLPYPNRPLSSQP